jgi:hypothetical protein
VSYLVKSPTHLYLQLLSILGERAPADGPAILLSLPGGDALRAGPDLFKKPFFFVIDEEAE